MQYSMANGGLVLDKVMKLYCDYGVQIIFAGNRWVAERLALSILRAANSVTLQQLLKK
jgi:hypothetical protein